MLERIKWVGCMAKVNYKIEPVAVELRRAREEKGLTQRELSAKVGIPQSHLSKIEAGLVDLKSSSLIEIARALELEPMLIPRQLISLVRGLIRSREITSREDQPPQPKYQLDEDEE